MSDEREQRDQPAHLEPPDDARRAPWWRDEIINIGQIGAAFLVGAVLLSIFFTLIALSEGVKVSPMAAFNKELLDWSVVALAGTVFYSLVDLLADLYVHIRTQRYVARLRERREQLGRDVERTAEAEAPDYVEYEYKPLRLRDILSIWKRRSGDASGAP